MKKIILTTLLCLGASTLYSQISANFTVTPAKFNADDEITIIVSGLDSWGGYDSLYLWLWFWDIDDENQTDSPTNGEWTNSSSAGTKQKMVQIAYGVFQIKITPSELLTNATNGIGRIGFLVKDNNGNFTYDGNNNKQTQDVTKQVRAYTTYIYENSTWTPNINSAAGTDNFLVKNGSAVLTSIRTMDSLTIDLGATIKIEKQLTINDDIINNGDMVFVNDADDLGQLANMTGNTLSGSGNVTVQRYIPGGRRAYRFISSPVSTTESIHDNWQEGASPSDPNPRSGYGTHITGTDAGTNKGFDASGTGDPSLYIFENANHAWAPIANTNVLKLEAGKGYRLYVRGNRSVDLTNNNAPASSTILEATGSNSNFTVGSHAVPNLSGPAGTYNFVGNPYQGIVDMYDAITTSSTGLNTFYYWVWDPNINSHGGYVAVTLLTGANSAGSGANRYLMPGQGFLVYTTSASPSLTFKEGHKRTYASETPVFREEPSASATISMQLYETQTYLQGGAADDGFLVHFTPGESNEVLPNDAPKLANPLYENLCLRNGNDYLSIENRDMPTDEEVLLIFTNQYYAANEEPGLKDYTFKVMVSGATENVTAYLKDAYLQRTTKLPVGTSTIDFSVDKTIPGSIAVDRFSIEFSAKGLSVEENMAHSFSVYPNPSNGNFFITAPQLSGEKVQVSMYNILGQRVYYANKEIGPDQRAHIKAEGFTTGVYIVEMTYKDKTFTKKLMVQ